MSSRTLLILLLLSISLLEVSAQNRLIPAPDVVTLREVWQKRGTLSRADRYGANVWGGIDLTGDSIGDFGVYRQSTNQWLFYEGGPEPDTAAFLVVDSVGRTTPHVGEFFGDGRQFMLFRSGYAEVIEDRTYYYDIYFLLQIDGDSVATEPFMLHDYGKASPPISRTILDTYVGDVNNDHIDDAVFFVNGLIVGLWPTSYNPDSQMWIHLGGSNFSLSEPDIIVYDTGFSQSPELDWEVRFADFDGDGRIDMMTGGGYRGTGEMIRFYWGDENSPQSWSERDFDRSIVLEHGVHGINDASSLHVFDGDGDGAMDIGAREYAEYEGTRLYLSGRGKSIRTRSFGLDDADVVYDNAIIHRFPIGFLNDSTRRYQPFSLTPTAPAPPAFWVVSGGSWGPDNDYDAAFATGHFPDFPFAFHSKGVRDVTGDGWDDFLGARDNFGAIVSEGIAILLAGGPYIPFDDPTVSVREEPVAGDSRGLWLWPNPVDDELNIAWRGDLRRMPVRFEVFDAGGASVVSGTIDAWRGKALWQCADVPNGSYLLVGYDEQGRRIASAPVLLQR